MARCNDRRGSGTEGALGPRVRRGAQLGRDENTRARQRVVEGKRHFHLARVDAAPDHSDPAHQCSYNRLRDTRGMAVTVDELMIADPPELWEELGFRVEDDACQIGTVRVCLDSRAGKRIVSWSLRGCPADGLDGLATQLSSGEARDAAEPHPNGVTAIDHVVAFSPDLD